MQLVAQRQVLLPSHLSSSFAWCRPLTTPVASPVRGCTPSQPSIRRFRWTSVCIESNDRHEPSERGTEPTRPTPRPGRDHVASRDTWGHEHVIVLTWRRIDVRTTPGCYVVNECKSRRHTRMLPKSSPMGEGDDHPTCFLDTERSIRGRGRFCTRKEWYDATNERNSRERPTIGLDSCALQYARRHVQRFCYAV